MAEPVNGFSNMGLYENIFLGKLIKSLHMASALLVSKEISKNIRLGSECGSVSRAVASETRGPRFESSHRPIYFEQLGNYLLTAVLKKIAAGKIVRPTGSWFQPYSIFNPHIIFFVKTSIGNQNAEISRWALIFFFLFETIKSNLSEENLLKVKLNKGFRTKILP